MKKILPLVFVLAFGSSVFGQQNLPVYWVSVNLGSQMTDIAAANSQGENLNYTNRLNFLNGIGLSYFNKNILVDLNIDYYTVSAVLVDDDNNTSINLGYLQPSLNVGYVFSIGSFPLRPRVGVGFGQGFLINGETQTDGILTDVRVANTVKNMDSGVNANVGVMVLNEAGISMSAIYNYRHGLTSIGSSLAVPEMKTRIHSLLIKIQLAL
jgi:hypothetical protein